MKNVSLYIVPFLTLLVGCKEEPKPKVKYDSTAPKVEIKKDTSRLEIADLPLQFQNSNVLLYVIGDLRVGEMKKNGYEDKANFTISNSLEEEVTGYLRNVKFQKVGEDSLHVLTDKVLMIERMSYLKSKKMIVYVLADADTNQDLKVDSDDIKSLYLSTDMGKNFTKISPDVQELIDWNFIENTNKVYFRTIEDANKNGEFDKKDKLHYFSVNLSEDWKSVEFSPVK
ncbi:hypothetical protein EQG63_09365 [Flavobacterium amnicola]|jgi:hypothetical protein|uniref:Uncharacterized protein n=1 Tax=Flavobacterium amnicola TaxID=2506422 RepID=A0A4Q1K248_9FLAO|nr:hypothetical protein [Flavobacterium amnicola]RXR17688.1 hypothetical protein EQG63_09365 [Flavobacterium amnicola]